MDASRKMYDSRMFSIKARTFYFRDFYLHRMFHGRLLKLRLTWIDSEGFKFLEIHQVQPSKSMDTADLVKTVSIIVGFVDHVESKPQLKNLPGSVVKAYP